jgi:hypothetical protein
MEVYFEYNRKSILNFEFLKDSYKNGRLQGANVLAKLLKIDENSPFKEEEFNKNIFKEFGIRRHIWNYITIFLKTNIMPVSTDIAILDIMQVTTILGGIPSIDEYYINYQNEKLQKRKKYNPQKPCEDHKQLFHWIICKDTDFNFFQLQLTSKSKNYTACKIFRVAPSTVVEYCYFRKPKDGIDLSEEYVSENESESEDIPELENENENEYEQVSVNQALSNIHLQLMEEE